MPFISSEHNQSKSMQSAKAAHTAKLCTTRKHDHTSEKKCKYLCRRRLYRFCAPRQRQVATVSQTMQCCCTIPTATTATVTASNHCCCCCCCCRCCSSCC